jgi:hypothetical protein
VAECYGEHEVPLGHSSSSATRLTRAPAALPDPAVAVVWSGSDHSIELPDLPRGARPR